MKTRIIKLLRLAKDQADTPEGKTAARLAEKLQEKFGIAIEEDDFEDESPKLTRHWVVSTGEERSYWIEFLLTGLCDNLYGGIAIPFQGPPWMVAVVGDNEIDVHGLQKHFDYLKTQIEIEAERKRDLERLYAYDSELIEHRVNSFLYGLVYEVVGRLQSKTEGIAAEITFTEEYETQKSTSTALVKTEDYEVQLVEPDWYHFDHGRKTAQKIAPFHSTNESKHQED